MSRASYIVQNGARMGAEFTIQPTMYRPPLDHAPSPPV